MHMNRRLEFVRWGKDFVEEVKCLSIILNFVGKEVLLTN